MANYTWLKTSTFRLVSIFQGYPEILRITGEYFKHILKCQESKNVKNILYYSILFLHHYVWMKRTQKVKKFYLRSCHLEQIDWSIRRRWLKKRKKKNVKPLGWWYDEILLIIVTSYSFVSVSTWHLLSSLRWLNFFKAFI